MSTTRPFVFKKVRPLSEEDRIPVSDVGPFLAQEPKVLARLGQEVRQALKIS